MTDMPHFEIHKDPNKNILELLITTPDGQRWEYGIPFNHRGEFEFDDIHPIGLEFGEDFATDLISALERAADAALADL